MSIESSPNVDSGRNAWHFGLRYQSKGSSNRGVVSAAMVTIAIALSACGNGDAAAKDGRAEAAKVSTSGTKQAAKKVVAASSTKDGICASAKGNAAKPGKFSLEGITLGAELDTALPSLCASEKGHIRLKGQVKQARTHQTYSEAGFHQYSQIPELPVTLRVPGIKDDYTVERNALSKPYRSSVTYCLGCDATRDDGKILQVSLLPSGKVFGLTLEQKFREGETFNPVALGSLLSPMTGRFGTPSLLYEMGPDVVVGWVLPQGALVQPTERWFAGQGRSEFEPSLELNNAGSIRDVRGAVSAAKLRAQNPRATYCMNRHVGLFGTHRQAELQQRVFRYDVNWQKDDGYSQNRMGDRAANRAPVLPYNVKYEAPGFVDKCGVIVVATFSKGPRDQDVGDAATFRRGDSDTPIYRLKVRMVDTDAVRAQFITEEREVYASITPSEQPKAASQRDAPASGSQSKEQAASLASRQRSADAQAWKACLTKYRQTSTMEDRKRCAHLDPLGRNGKS